MVAPVDVQDPKRRLGTLLAFVFGCVLVVATTTETAKPQTPTTETAKPQTPTTETAKPQTPTTETAKPQTPTTETAKPQTPTTETAKPQTPTTETGVWAVLAQPYVLFQFFTGAFALLVGVVLIWACFNQTTNKEDRAINFLVGIGGLAFGWLAGIVLAPFTATETAQFSAYAGALSAFVTGYASGKLDDLVKYVLNPQNLTRRRAFHGVLFLVAFVTSLIVAFEFRFYHIIQTTEPGKPAGSTTETAKPQTPTTETAKPQMPTTETAKPQMPTTETAKPQMPTTGTVTPK